MMKDGPFSFERIHGNHLIYNTCWEDPRLDRIALKLSSKDTVAMITSAGCNALDYVLAGAGRVIAVDMNPRQNALLELKVAAAHELGYQDFFALFGQGHHPDARAVYNLRLREYMSPHSRTFWDQAIDLFSGSARRGSFYFRGTTGFFAYLLNIYIDHIARLRGALNELLSLDTQSEQMELFDREIEPYLIPRALKWLMSKDLTLALLGVPPAQRRQIDQSYPGGIAAFALDSIRTVFRDLPLKDNYFWQVYLKGAYTRTALPEYLKEENFALLKATAMNRIRTITGPLHDYLKKECEQISRFVLLDHMDWLAENRPDVLREGWQAIVDRAAPGARIIWRSAGLEVDYVDPIEVRTGRRRQRLADLLQYDRELAGQLHARDRVHTYGNFYIAELCAA